MSCKVVVTLLRLAAVLTALACVSVAGAGESLKVHVGIRAEFAVAAAGSVWTTNSIERRHQSICVSVAPWP